MLKHNSIELSENQLLNDNKNNINVNLWVLGDSTFFFDNNNNNLESTGTFKDKEVYNNINNINIISSKNQPNLDFNLLIGNSGQNKSKNKSVNSSYIKDYIAHMDKKKLIKSNLSKNTLNNKKKNKKKNNSFSHNNNLNDSFSNNFNINKKLKKSLGYLNQKQNKKMKQRMNNSMDYCSKENEDSNSPPISYGHYHYNKKQNLKKSLSIENINNINDFYNNNKYNNNAFITDDFISNLKYNNNEFIKMNIYKFNFSNNNNNRLKKSNSINSKIYKNNKINLNIKDTKKYGKIDINSYNIKVTKEKKLNSEKDIVNKNRNISSKKSIENAEKYTDYLSKKKIFTQDYVLQNKLKKQKEEQEEEKEMSQCTFKPHLYNNKYNSRIQSQKNNKKKWYEKQSQWLNNIQKKKENEREKKTNKEIQECTFVPKLSSLPNYNNKKNKITNRELIGEENYYNKMKKARQLLKEKRE